MAVSTETPSIKNILYESIFMEHSLYQEDIDNIRRINKLKHVNIISIFHFNAVAVVIKIYSVCPL